MRLNEIEFRDWCRKNQVTKGAKAVIERIRNSEPSRRVRSGNHSVSGAFPSCKMGVTIQYESHKNELPFIHELERDPNVLEYYDQPSAFTIKYLSKSGKATSPTHTPDFFVIYNNSASWIECKTENDLLKLALNQPNRYRLNENDEWICPPGEEYASQFGLHYKVRSSKQINWIFQRNIEYLDDYYRKNSLDVAENIYFLVTNLVRKEPSISLQELFEKTEGTASRDDIFSLIASEAIYVDLYSSILSEPDSVPVFPSEESSIAFKNANHVASISQQAERSGKPETVSLLPGNEIVWDGKGWKILNAGENVVTLVDVNQTVSEIDINIFEKLVISGKIKGSSLLVESNISGEIAGALIEASKEDLAIANYRLPFVLAKINDDEYLDDSQVDRRTIRRWVKAYRQALKTFGNGYSGLIPQRNGGNTLSKIEAKARELLLKFIAEVYQNEKQKNRSVVYLEYEAECEKLLVTPASFVTFCEYIKKLSKYEQTLKRKGKRAAYKYEEFYWRLSMDTPRHGERPFHIAHIDHTELDIELVDSVTGKNLGRPWLTLMIDAFSRRILAVYLTFNSPSKISCMMVMRECVRRHGRLPQILVVDGGKEFASVYFETLLACYEVNKKTRPPAKARFGSVIERLFGTAHSQFIHNLIGNTQITKNVRQVTKSNNPRNKAVWTLPRLFERLCEWAYVVYDQIEHSTLCQTPQDVFAKGMLNSGERLHRLIPYNEEFKLMTLPSTTKGTAKVDYNRGVKINKIFYFSDEFRNPEVMGSSVPVRYDPFDIGIAHAYVKGKWRKCRAYNYAVFSNRSEREIYLATEELKKRQGAKTVTLSQLAKFLKSVEAEELLLKPRMIDREQRPITALINGSIVAEDASEYTFINAPDDSETDNNSSNVLLFPSAQEKEAESEEEDNFVVYQTL